MGMAKETGLQARDTDTAAPSSQPQTTPTTFSESTIRQRYPPLTTQFSERDVCRFLFSKDRQSVFPDRVTVTYSMSDRGYSYYTELTECGSMAKYGPGTTAETRTTTDTRGQVHTETAKTLYLHRAWNVKWEASDTANLPVSLPELTSGIVIQSWEPSTTHSSGGNNGGYYKGPNNPDNAPTYKEGGDGLDSGLRLRMLEEQEETEKASIGGGGAGQSADS
ncbi:hypothetical protein K4F52_007100 [Lecanicillium sp. MT-2017a]|nr:hypothetical protein K4F52_007100 [Lecanicillium sp. MT-2017a]